MNASTINPEQLAAETIEILRSRCIDAVRFAEAYGHEGRTIVADGSMLSPSDRALPNGERAYQSEPPTSFETWRDLVDAFLADFTVPEDTDGEPDDWTFGWEDGCLFAYAPELPQD